VLLQQAEVTNNHNTEANVSDANEQIVDSMIADGMRIMIEAIELYKPVQIVAAYSSGDDSIVSTHFTMENFKSAFVFNADTTIGLKPARDHLVSTCDKQNWQLEVGRADPIGPPKTMTVMGKRIPFDPKSMPSGRWTDGDTAYEEYCLNFGFPGPGMHPRMYQRLKERPIRKMLSRFGATASKKRAKVLIVSGIRQDESSRRAGYQRASAAGNFGDVWVNPFYYHTAADFAAYRDEFGLPRNPVKRLCGISGECCCGTFKEENERKAYEKADPAFVRYLSTLEGRVAELGLPCRWGERPPASFVAANQMIVDAKRGQGFLFEADERLQVFQPMCVGCNNGRR
jgi:3'-phosphoadenosine 5'-phosphosulfate sulfotransferase (PAPS reductase)/FAD synthetase